MHHQSWNVFAAHPQRWQQKRKHIQSMVEIATKVALLRHLPQIAVCCIHQTHVYLMSAGAPQTLKLLLLHDAQQFGLGSPTEYSTK